MLRRIKAFIQGGFLRLGYKIVPAIDEDGMDRIGAWMGGHNFMSILDIGANEGQFANKIRKIFPQAFIHSFEPLPHIYGTLKANFAGDANFQAYNLAVGSEKGKSTIILNHHSASSSMLNMSDEFGQHFDFVKADKEIEINVDKLDNIFSNIELRKPYLIKIDVQGFEREVIAGGKITIEKSDMVIIEVSFKELYKNQVLFDEIYDNMRTLGFKYSGSIDQLFSPVNGELLQADALFIKVNGSHS